MGKKGIQEPRSLKEAFQNLIPESTTLIQGEVISDEPLKIRSLNDKKLVITNSMLSLPEHLTKYKASIDIQVEDGDNIKNATMTIHNQLKEGDVVYLLSLHEGKTYYVLDREG